ncbi:hypothetical protein PoB_007266700 [Plakobranchus ocellatus]|uniref:Uncharacterized protein n=1 Tax=Plakobranchus ocellatus TaxID=259542 RepID=A0AAV4DPY1_9GAST|nr:hypothetical protein PoB_007266700 [Plakobranchus ocellatus]
MPLKGKWCRTPLPTLTGTESPTKLSTCSLMDLQNTNTHADWNGESNQTLYMKPYGLTEHQYPHRLKRRVQPNSLYESLWTCRSPIPTPTGTESQTKLST